MRLVALFVDPLKQAAIANALAPHGVDLVPMPSMGGVLQALKRGQAQAVLLEDADTGLTDWLGMLQTQMAGGLPVIVVGGASGLGMAEALAHGATDYAEYDDRTGSSDQLLARLLARVGPLCAPARQGRDVGPYSLSEARSSVWRDGIEISLTSREFALAWMLFSNVGHVVPASSLAARVWGRSTDVCKRTLEQHVYRLRRKLAANGAESAIRIQAVYSIGYRLDLRVRNYAAWPVRHSGEDASVWNDFSGAGTPTVKGPAETTRELRAGSTRSDPVRRSPSLRRPD